MGTEKKMVKCLICGAVFEAGIEVCPVCGVGPENFVDFEEEKTSFKKNTSEKFLILGNGVAGVSAAEAIRERNATCNIVIATNESVLAYNRPMLTKSLMGEMTPEQMAIHGEEWYKEKNILNLLEMTVESIDPEKKEVTFAGNVRLQYDQCIYALGSQCFIPPIPGHDKPQVIAIRSLSDTEKIEKLLPSVKEVVVIGGGVLGLEAAWELHKAGCKVTVLELAPQLMGRQLDGKSAEVLTQIIKEKGIDIHLSVKIEEIQGDDSVSGVRLGDGTVLPAQMVIISAGVRANTAAAKTAGVEIGRAVMVNERMETSVEDIYACGDCAEFEGINYAIWPEAVEMGIVAGSNAAGERKAYKTVAAALTFNGMDTSLFAIGDNGKDPQKEYSVERFQDETKHSFRTFYYVEGKMTGAVLIGDTSEMANVTEKIMK